MKRLISLDSLIFAPLLLYNILLFTANRIINNLPLFPSTLFMHLMNNYENKIVFVSNDKVRKSYYSNLLGRSCEYSQISSTSLMLKSLLILISVEFGSLPSTLITYDRTVFRS